MPAEAPSGRQFEIHHGDQRAVIVEVGATIREYTVGQATVLDGFDASAMADGGRGQPLLPWPNRLADGQYEFDGQALQLPIDELSRRNASHGLTRWLSWRVTNHQQHQVTLSHVIHPRPGYPFTLALEIEYALSEMGLAVQTTAHNRGTRALPYGAGFHPYVTVGTPRIDHALLKLPARSVLAVDERLIPTGDRRDVSGTELDFRTARVIAEQRIDACFADLQRDPDGRTRVELCRQDSQRAVTLWMDDAFKYIQVFTGDTLAPHRRRQSIAIEPMTCPPNAFRSGVDLVRIEPEQRHTGGWGIFTTR